MSIKNIVVLKNIIQAGENLNISVESTQDYEGELCARLIIFKIGKYYNDFVLDIPSQSFSKNNREYVFSFLIDQALEAGLYMIRSGKVIGKKTNCDFSCSSEEVFPLFKVTQGDPTEVNKKELQTEFKEIVLYRDKVRESGVGSQTEDSKKYTVYCFVKNCLISRKLDFLNYRLLPFGYFSQESIGERILSYFPPTLFKDSKRQIIENLGAEPALIVEFPVLWALDFDSGKELALQESRRVTSVLSLGKNSYGTIVGGLIIDKSSNECQLFLHAPGYSGNLLGGAMAGEHLPSLKKQIEAIKLNEILECYYSLFNSAMLEKNIEQRYFKLWSLLETIARSMNYVGRQKKTWEGRAITNTKNEPIKIQNQAAELVFELLRESLHVGFGVSYSKLADQCSVEALVIIWYRHRNCLSHYGRCAPYDGDVCLRSKDKYVACKRAHDEIVRKYKGRTLSSDIYLDALMSASKMVIQKLASTTIKVT